MIQILKRLSFNGHLKHFSPNYILFGPTLIIFFTLLHETKHLFSMLQNFLTESLKQLDKMYPQNNLSVSSSQQQAQSLADVKPKDLGVGEMKKWGWLKRGFALPPALIQQSSNQTSIGASNIHLNADNSKHVAWLCNQKYWLKYTYQNMQPIV